MLILDGCTQYSWVVHVRIAVACDHQWEITKPNLAIFIWPDATINHLEIGWEDAKKRARQADPITYEQKDGGK